LVNVTAVVRATMLALVNVFIIT